MKYMGRFTSAILLAVDTTFAFAPNFFLTTTDRSSSLFMSKNNHRARLEKNLEELMDRDWRVFRAKLVAQEAIEQKEHDDRSRANPEMYEKQSRQEKFGNIFAAIFNNKHSTSGSIFDGNSIGGATSESILPECEDPFVSHAEIPVLMQSKVIIDKHRWAHPITHIEPGCVLVANEKLGGVFHQTVILITEHNDAVGSKGIVINRCV
jgi:putative transcriptional regulator